MSEAISTEAMMKKLETVNAPVGEKPLFGTFVGTIICISMALGLVCLQTANSVTDANIAGRTAAQLDENGPQAEQMKNGARLVRTGAILHLSKATQCPPGSEQLAGFPPQGYGREAAQLDPVRGENTGELRWGRPGYKTCKI